MIVLEETRETFGQTNTLVEQRIHRGDEARKIIEPEVPTRFPTCGATDIKYASNEDGSMGYWCYQCKKSLKAMKDPLYQQKANLYFKLHKICRFCAEARAVEILRAKKNGGLSLRSIIVLMVAVMAFGLLMVLSVIFILGK